MGPLLLDLGEGAYCYPQLLCIQRWDCSTQLILAGHNAVCSANTGQILSEEVLTTILPDGPALRATALITYANWLVANSNKTFVTTTLWPIIKLDLDYVMNLWNQTT